MPHRTFTPQAGGCRPEAGGIVIDEIRTTLRVSYLHIYISMLLPFRTARSDSTTEWCENALSFEIRI
jgi:hypothetical protein